METSRIGGHITAVLDMYKNAFEEAKASIIQIETDFNQGLYSKTPRSVAEDPHSAIRSVIQKHYDDLERIHLASENDTLKEIMETIVPYPDGKTS